MTTSDATRAEMRATYEAGTWIAIAGPGVWAICELDPESPLVAALADAAAHGADLDDLLGIVVQEGLRAIGSFVLASPRGQLLALAVRGAGRATKGDGTVIDGAARPTWLEATVDIDGGGLRLHGADVTTSPLSLPLTGGVVFAGAISLSTSASSSVHREPAAEARAPDEGGLMPEPASETIPTYGAAETPTPDRLDPAPAPDHSDGGAVAVADHPAATLADDEGLDPDAVPAMNSLFDPTSQRRLSPINPPAPADAAQTRQPPPADDDGAPPNAYPQGGVSAPPAYLPAPPTHLPAPPTHLPAPPTHLPAPPSAAAVPQATFMEPTPQSGLISQFPWAPDAPPISGHFVSTAAVPPPSAVQTPPSGPDAIAVPTAAGDHTVSRSALRAMASAPTPAGPTVLAAYCPAGHLSPAHAPLCRVCDRPIPPQREIIEVARPTLGALRLPSGDLIPLDRGVVLGRAPSAPVGNVADRPHAVAVPDPQKHISRTHLEIRLDLWHVLAIDLGTENGTFVTLPGAPAQRLTPHEPFLLRRGAIVDLAEVLPMTFEILE
jgi:hypothetical protein